MPSSSSGFDGGSVFDSTATGTAASRSDSGAVLVWLSAGDLESTVVVRCNSVDGWGCVDDGDEDETVRTAAIAGRGERPVVEEVSGGVRVVEVMVLFQCHFCHLLPLPSRRRRI
jgi:hypothetical protein